MVEQFSNDNSTAASGASHAPDAHGQAALLLVESLMHGLIARTVITPAEAVEIVDVAAEIKVEVATELREPRVVMEHSLALLRAIGESLKTDTLEQD